VLCLVSNTNYLNYRAVLSTFTPEADTVALTEADCDALGIGEGDQVHIVALNSRETL
jgi:arginine N-succinyltransferase